MLAVDNPAKFPSVVLDAFFAASMLLRAVPFRSSGRFCGLVNTCVIISIEHPFNGFSISLYDWTVSKPYKLQKTQTRT